MPRSLDQTTVAEIRRLRRNGGQQQDIAAAMSVDVSSVRRHTDVDYADRQREWQRQGRDRRLGLDLPEGTSGPLYDPRLDDAVPAMSLTGVLCGDPQPGRRELIAGHVGSYWRKRGERW